MERARKMIIVPEDVIERVQTTPAAEVTLTPNEVSSENSMQTPGDNLSRLDAKMFDILHSKRGEGRSRKMSKLFTSFATLSFFP